ncbi:hypothetical protein [Oceanibacterium hippocampi]|nr:hypothetical protein [Oceanibacterium hippocampi]
MTSDRTATRRDIEELAGGIEAVQKAEIMALGTTLSELGQALAWAAGEGDATDRDRLPLAGRAAQVHRILTLPFAFDEEE